MMSTLDINETSKPCHARRSGSTGYGSWNGVRYEVKVDEYLKQKGLILIEVPKEILLSPGEIMQTGEISFLGFTWTACVTATEDDMLEAYFSLHDAIPHPSPQCSWWINDPSTVPGRESHLIQGGQYGGKIHRSRMQIGRDEAVILTFNMQLEETRRENFSVSIDGPMAYCRWAVKPKLDAEYGEYWTKTFTFAGRKLGLWMVERRGACQTFFLHLPSELDASSIDCRVILFNRIFPGRSVAARKQGRGWQIKIPTVDFRLSLASDREGFLYDGWLTFGLHISMLQQTPSASVNEIGAFNRSKICIEVLTDKLIQTHIEKEGLTEIFRIPRSKMYILSMNEPLETVKEMIVKDAGLHEIQSTIWLCPAKQNSMFTRAVCVDDLEELKPHLGELIDHTKTEDHPTLTFFFRENKNMLCPRWHQSSVLVFGMLLNKAERKLDYLGSVFSHKQSKLHVLCFTDLCGLDQRLESMECCFFVWNMGTQITQIRTYQQTIENIGLPSGSVIIIRPMSENEMVTLVSVQQELYGILKNYASSATSIETTSSTPSNDTFICLDSPSTGHNNEVSSGFLYGNA